jgi:hypothetical protein
MRKFQIGVMGSASDLKYAKEVEQAAEKLGELVALRGGGISVWCRERLRFAFNRSM